MLHTPPGLKNGEKINLLVDSKAVSVLSSNLTKINDRKMKK